MAREGVVAFAFGVPATILSNRRIAEIASKKARELNAPVYTQRDVQIESGIAVKFIEEKSGEPPPTLRIARGAVRWAKKKGISELWIVAAAPHLWRCKRDLSRAVSEMKSIICVRVCNEITQYSESSWYCLDSMQARTRSAEDWWKRERILHKLPFFFYKLIAS